MEIKSTPIQDLYVIQPLVFRDNRGYFFESFNQKKFQEKGVEYKFVQDNESKSQKGVLRGLHFQKPPFAQGKLVRVISGSVLDVAVDIRSKSPTYGKYFSIILSEENKTMLWIPQGFAHGFVTLEDNTIFSYKCTNFYNKESEGSILWSDSELAINWGIEEPTLSDKDKNAPIFKDLVSPF